MSDIQGDAAPAVLWTALPAAAVLGGEAALPPPVPEIVQVMDGHRILFLQPVGGGVGRLVRLNSPDPLDYLSPRWQIGARVPLP